MNENALVGAVQLSEMLSNVSFNIFKIIDSHFYEDNLNQLARSYVRFKQKETTLWPQLTLYTHFMLGGNSPSIYHAAAQTELIVLSLDVLDDLQDQDNLAPPWMQSEQAVAMNCASGLLIAAIAGEEHRPIDSSLLKLLSTAHNGQHKDIGKLIHNEETYLQLVAEKSASLLNLAIQIAYTLTDNPNPTTTNQLAQFAHHIGIAAQLRNDTKGLADFHNRNDIAQRKLTLSTLYLLDQSSRLFPPLRSYYDGNLTIEELFAREQQLLEFIHTSGVYEYTSAVQSLYLKQADQLLSALNALQPWERSLRAITIDAFLN